MTAEKLNRTTIPRFPVIESARCGYNMPFLLQTEVVTRREGAPGHTGPDE